jgi:tetratricopeptide (TPR) repeat protein
MNHKKSLSRIFMIATPILVTALFIFFGYSNWILINVNKAMLGNPNAILELDSAGQLFRDSNATNYLDYRIEVARGNLSGAETLLGATSKSDYFKQVQLTRIGQLYLKNNDLDNAIRICLQIKTEILTQDIYQLGYKAYQQKEWLTVIQIYSFRIKLEPSNRSAHRTLVAAYKGLNDLDNAIREAMNILTFIEPVQIQDYQEIADLYIKKGLPQEAEYWWSVARLMFPDSETPLINLMWNSYNQGQINKEKTLGYADTLVSNFPDHFPALNNAADIYFRTGVIDKAENYARQAIALKPNDASAHYVLGKALSKKNYDEAFLELETSIRLDPNSFLTWIFLGDMVAVKDTQQAIQYYQSALNVKNLTPDQKSVALDKLKKYGLP